MKKALLVIAILSILLLAGCVKQPDGSSRFDIVALVQNPVVMVVGGIIIVYLMMKKSK